jgi:hypothetical protein
MHRATIAALGVLVAVVLFLGCGSPSTNSPRGHAPGARAGPSAADVRSQADRAAAFSAVEGLEAAIAAARAAVDSTSAKAATATVDQRLRSSDTRRAIVVANVALQKAREALGREDYAAAQQATLGMAEHLKDVVGKMRD